MVELTLKDSKATGGGCNCGCGHEHGKAKEAVAAATCNCGPDCTCGCQEGKPCTCGTADTTVARYTVTGMTCSHCVSAVTEEVSSIPGVTDVAVDLDSGALTVASDAPVDFDRIVEAVAEAGDYSVV
ncbi:MAG: heavy-metal-associated domain-containing protein [Actinomycetes bacterium]